MDLNKISLFNAMKQRMGWSARRQEVLADNIANADTPKYKARDLKAFSFKDTVQRQQNRLNLDVTNASHLGGRRVQVSEFRDLEDRAPFEVSPGGNSVVLEEQMAKINETGVSYKLTTQLYKKHLAMLRTALGTGR